MAQEAHSGVEVGHGQESISGPLSGKVDEGDPAKVEVRQATGIGHTGQQYATLGRTGGKHDGPCSSPQQPLIVKTHLCPSMNRS
ncbi:MAG TPA: hypothetical protein PLL57_13890, partial [Flavobacteriales bacterium]|nr:hypothetical protein [Flavobacteriales bacterium]